jgi:hypothetical protein
VDKPDTRATVRQRSLQPVRPDQLERRLQERLDALGPPARAELLHVLILPDFERADRIGEFWGYPESRAFAELLIDCEEDRTLRAVLVGMLREMDSRGAGSEAGDASRRAGTCVRASPPCGVRATTTPPPTRT